MPDLLDTKPEQILVHVATQSTEISTNVISTSTYIKPANEIEDQKSTKLAVLGIGLDIERIEISTFVRTAA